MTNKVADICINGMNLVCIMNSEAKYNPFTVYKKWYDNGAHRKKLIAFGHFISAMEYMNGYYWTHLAGCVPMRQYMEISGAEYEARTLNGTL